MSKAIKNPRSTMPQRGLVQRNWHIVDAKDKVLGRVSTHIANLLTGKNKPIYTPAVDCGDFVIALNVAKIQLTGKKLEQKHTFRHSGYQGNFKNISYKRLMEEKPQEALFLSVKRMLPRTRLASRQILRLKMFKGDQHPHLAQQPKALDVKAE